jgi:hypothetical protein
MIGVGFPTGAGNFSLHCRVQNGSGAHPASYPVGTRGSFLGGKVVGAWNWPPPSCSEVKECVELFLHSPICIYGVVLSSETFMAMEFQVEVFWVVTTCGVVVVYYCFRDPCCLHILGCDNVWCCGGIPLFQRSMLPPYSGLWQLVVLWWYTNVSEIHAVSIFWDVTSCRVAVGCQLVRGPCCLHLLGCDTVYCCGRIPTFQRSMLPPSSGMWRRVVLW